MSIEKFTTSGIIVSHYEVGESDVVCRIYTRDFGMISARQSSLKKSNKLRQHLSLCRLTDVTVVKGKEIYRIVGARESLTQNFNPLIIAHISQLIQRFLPYEVKNIRLYDRFVEYAKSKSLDPSILRICILCDIMIVSGYMSTEDISLSLEEYKTSSIDDLYIKVITDKLNIVQKLKRAIDSSML